uniref:Uncharacterized protein n=1 Tax=Dulem virus 38 TaxID=3145756 RepID=A0AAU8B0H6_9CAUD
MRTGTAVIDDVPEPEGGFDPIVAASQMMDAQEGILTITGACADIRSRMVLEQGWGEDFANAFAQDLARGLVNQALSPKADLRALLEGL